MGFFDRVVGREHPTGARTDDELAIERYEHLLATAPPETVEQAHTEAFAKLTPEQRDMMFDRFVERASTPRERPAHAQPETFAKTVTRTPGMFTRMLGGSYGDWSFSSTMGSSILRVFDHVIGSELAIAFMVNDFGGENVSGDSVAGNEAGDDFGF
ncbi:hypothetical protein [Microbispora sp. NBC_01389]|uniref:hypothetical protein n=1 Tax=Microbispora sp. NBC_01389 TaxID=2903584 RepID=UPI00324EA1DB